MTKRITSSAIAVLCAVVLWGPSERVVAQTTTAATAPAPTIVSLSYPQGGSSQIIFRGKGGPFRIQKRDSLAATTPWTDVLEAKVTEVQPGVFMAMVPRDQQDAGYYRVVSENEVVAELKGWSVRLEVSTPANKTHYVKGEKPVVTVTILDTMAQGVSRGDFSALGLYMHGPEEPMLTTTPVKLLNATADRTKTPHHYIDLRTNPDAKLNGTVVTYPLQAVSDEAPGTYTVTLRAVLGSDAVQQVMKFVKVQIGTDKVEQPVISDAKCASCHLGAQNKKMYMHHIDVSSRSRVGSFALDLEPQNSCKACHNIEGYAAFTDASAPGGRRPDHIVIRAHGVHMGEHLKSDFNTNQVTGNFRDYTHVLFPADVRDCTSCHVGDSWKTKPSRLACGSCHDNSWFGPKTSMPAGMVAHAGGPATDDTTCATCHVQSKVFKTVEQNHLIAPEVNEISISMSPPANKTNYVAGEKPLVSLVFKDDAGKAIDQTLVRETNFASARLLVYGPRARAVPVLTTAVKDGNSKANASVTSRNAGPWAINGKTFKIAINGSAPQDIKIVGAANLVTAAEVVASLNTVITNLTGGPTASVSGANVRISSTVLGNAARIEIYNGDVTTAMGWKAPGVVLEPDVIVATAGFYQFNDIRARTSAANNDPRVTWSATNITYQLDDVAGLPAGTYSVLAYGVATTGKITGFTRAAGGLGHLTFQIGTATPEKRVAGNCADCHGDTIFHTTGNIHPAAFNNDQCLACHDYGRVSTGEMFKNQGGTSLAGWSGYGAMPEVRRIHGVHRGAYLHYPEEIYANATKDTFGHIIFSQDIRNCTKCHSESDSWKRNPSRMACLACHDSDAAKAHGKLMTFIGDPSDPYGPKAVETCVICHGAGTEFSPDKVHNISNPYVPPYLREPQE